MTARVLHVRVRPGQTVKQDEPLVDVLLPELLKASGTLSAATLRIQAYEARKARLGPLVEQGLARAAELSDLEANLALARSEREAARATLRVAGVNEAQAAGLLSNAGTISLRAPMPAMVVHVAARPGEIREPGSGPLLELVGQGPVQVEARLALSPPEGASFTWVAGGANVPLVLEALSPRAAPEDGTRLAWFHAQDPARAPVPGSLGRVHMGADPSWFVVPLAALRERGSAARVVVRDAQGSKEQPVGVVLRSSSEVIVTGLSADSEVAADATSASLATPPPASEPAP
jgi:multidrug efflux pump subunit AcrA (membrane-fusion protein)